MKQQIEIRLHHLKAELESGRTVLSELEARQSSVRDTLLRITGAIQVLEEELAKANDSEPPSDSQPTVAQANDHSKITTHPSLR